MKSELRSEHHNSGDSGSSGKIFIGGLPKDTRDDEFNRHFRKYGDITDSVIMKDRSTGQPRGFGFVTYADSSVVDRVIDDTHIFNGKQVKVQRTTPKGSAHSKDYKTKKLFVGGFPSSLDDDELKSFFSKYGKVVEHQIVRDQETNRSRRFGFVIFDSEEVVDELVASGKTIDMNGTQVEVKKAESTKPLNTPPPRVRESRPRSFPDESSGYGDGGPHDRVDGGYGNSGPYNRVDGGYGNSGPYDRVGGGYGNSGPYDRVDGGYGNSGPYDRVDGGYGAGPHRAPGRVGDYSRYGRYSDFDGYGDYGSYGGGYRSESSLGYTGRFGSYNDGGYSRGEGYGYGGPGFGGEYDSGPGFRHGDSYGRGGSYDGGSRYHPYSR